MQYNTADQASTMETTTSGFLRLSAELRNQIYTLAVVEDSPIRLCCLKRGTQQLYQYKSYENVSQPPLLRVNRQTRNEALAIFYGGNIFESNRTEPVVQWLEQIGPENRSFIRELRGFAIDIPWTSERRASGRAKKFERRMEAEGMSLRKGSVRAPCVESDLMLWVNRNGHVVETSKEEYVTRPP